LSLELGKILIQPALRERFANLGVEFASSTPIEFAATIRNEAVKWGKVFRDARVQPE
jgi:tripartite-type tricarboxylate transporter receptor subunit TctC